MRAILEPILEACVAPVFTNRGRLPRQFWNRFSILLMALASLCAAAATAAAGEAAAPSAGKWTRGFSASPDYFPIAVWVQRPENAPRYKAIGINLYIGLWRGPDAQQLAELKKHGLQLICSQNRFALEHLDEPTIVGWMHGDEPDNAQSLGQGKGYGPPVPAEKIIEDYKRIQAKDPSRPVILNLGQGVAWDGWYGRGVRTNHPEDYAEYVRACDIVSFDIYPAVHDHPAVAGKLWYVPRGVDRLRQWTGGQKPVWNCIECTRISNPKVKPTPQQVKAEVWMSIIRGSRGLIYFCHEFAPKSVEAGLLADAEMAQAVGGINRQIHELARVIHAPDERVEVRCEPEAVSKEMAAAVSTGAVVATARKQDGGVYVFAVRMETEPVEAQFRVDGVAGKAVVEVLGENRTLEATDGRFHDPFGPHAVHLYRIRGR